MARRALRCGIGSSGSLRRQNLLGIAPDGVCSPRIMCCSFHIPLSPCPSTYGLAKQEALERLSTRLEEGGHLCRNICTSQRCAASTQRMPRIPLKPAWVQQNWTRDTVAAASLCAVGLETHHSASKEPPARISEMFPTPVQHFRALLLQPSFIDPLMCLLQSPVCLLYVHL